MDGKDVNELRELVELLKANGITEFAMERDDLKVSLKFAGEAVSAPAAASGIDAATLATLLAARPMPPAAAPAIPAPAFAAAAEPAATITAAAEDPHAGASQVKSPIVGTFYASPSPDAEPFVKAGDRVEVGTVLCIVEAMKLMNEIESDVAGEVVAVLAVPGQPVEYGQPLFAIK